MYVLGLLGLLLLFLAAFGLEQWIASIGVSANTKPTTQSHLKDAGIFIYEHQPLHQSRQILKKSATPPNCLAVSSTHVFAAQEGKGVVHVYSREKGNQEAIVPFTERISSITLACNESVLVLGSVDGKIFLWEPASGRQITTAQSHLQAVIALAVDPTSNFLISASADSTCHIWSLPSLLSFSNIGAQALVPLQTFTSHRAEVTALAVGHSAGWANIAITASKDKTCLIWDYHSNSLLRTYLLPAVPASLVVDGADRAVYIGYEDGSVQQLDLYEQREAVQDARDSNAPIQPSAKSLWKPTDASVGAASSLSLSWDSCILLSGHTSGQILSWDVATGRLQNSILQQPLPGPVDNLSFLPVSGFAHEADRKFRIPAIVKPRFGAFDSGDGSIPGNYVVNIELTSSQRDADSDGVSIFEQALTAPSFPQALLDEGLAELSSWGDNLAAHANGAADGEIDEDFMTLDGPEKPGERSLAQENLWLKKQIDALRRLQTASFEKIDKINAERRALIKREQKRMGKGAVDGDESMGSNSGDDSDESD
ncbi:WD40 repeat-like protein [Teratosphaeria nubilosa]|uniref:Pre-rRNA-processing protein IPI3 n=1 Tax=Teratosphaeria nubilosa TaxID=161662 RepID=A0A6G1KUA7_9PEZI|nr:WD40 repeat-like protein [Teratosphaeria nubilosa]